MKKKSATDNPDDNAPPELEEQIQRLEKVVETLESGDVSLEKSIGLYEEGTKLGRSSLERLEALEQRVSLVRESGQDSLEQTPFDPEES